MAEVRNAVVDMAWPTAWTRASLELTVLALVCEHGPTHGYDVGRRLAQAGLGEVKGGTLYPVLGRLEEQGLIASRWAAGDGGPGRKVVAATSDGVHALAERRVRWREWTERVATLLDDSAPADGSTGNGKGDHEGERG